MSAKLIQLSTNSIITQGCSIDSIGYNFIWLDLL